MYNVKGNRPVFLSTLILLILLGSVLVGSTYASSTGVDYNNVTAQTTNETVDPTKDYAVALEYLSEGDYVSMRDSAALTDNMLWEPGKTELIRIRLTNTEKFDTSCTLTLNVTHNDFDDVMTYAIYDGNLSDLQNQNPPKKPPKNWTEFKEIARDLAKIGWSEKKEAVLSGSPKLLDKVALGAFTGTRYLTLAIHMDEKASSKYASKNPEDPMQMKFYFTLQVDANYKPGEDPASVSAR